MSKPLGRPKGSTSKDYESLIEFPAVCPVCGSNNTTVMDGYEPTITEQGGTRSDGFEYVRIERRYKQCECEQKFIVLSYIGAAEKTTSGS